MGSIGYNNQKTGISCEYNVHILTASNNDIDFKGLTAFEFHGMLT
jgi:hypothetical protein